MPSTGHHNSAGHAHNRPRAPPPALSPAPQAQLAPRTAGDGRHGHEEANAGRTTNPTAEDYEAADDFLGHFFDYNPTTPAGPTDTAAGEPSLAKSNAPAFGTTNLPASEQWATQPQCPPTSGCAT